MKRVLTALLVLATLVLSGGCGNISGDSNPGTQTVETPAPPPS